MRDLAIRIVKKTLSILLTVYLVATLVFAWYFIIPGDPTRQFFVHPGMSPEIYNEIVERYHLNDPLTEQYYYFLVNVFTGDLGISTSTWPGADVNDVIDNYIKPTLILFVAVSVVGMLIGFVLEEIVRRRRSRALSIFIHALSVILFSIPVFALSLTVLWANAGFDWGLPLHGSGLEPFPPFREDLDAFTRVLDHLWLPLIVGALITTGFFVLVARAGLAAASSRPNGASKGPEEARPANRIAEGLFLIRPFPHFFVAMTMASVLLVDMVFSYRGLGTLLFDALWHRDAPVAIACVLVVTAITLIAGLAFSFVIWAARDAKLSGLFEDWVHRPAAERQAAPGGVGGQPASMPLSGLAARLVRSLTHSLVGMAAVLVFIGLLVQGALAPVLSPVGDPTEIDSFEPSHPEDDWTNPLPPTMDPSPYTGWIHPMGTDQVGRDVFGLWLYAARTAVLGAVLVTIAGLLIGLAVGLLAAKTIRLDGTLASVLDFFGTVLARTYVAIPIFVIVVATTVFDRRETYSSMLYLVLVIYAWAWIVIARPVRERARALSSSTDTTHNVSVGGIMPSILAESLMVAKFAAVGIIVTEAAVEFAGLGGPTPASWGAMLENAWAYSSFVSGDWHLILSPLFGLMLLITSVFVVLDRLEFAARSVIRASEGIPSTPFTGAAPAQ